MNTNTLSKFDLQCDDVPDGYDTTTVPALTRDNFNKLLEAHNKLAQAVQELQRRLGINPTTR
jgi:hypothetical protein